MLFFTDGAGEVGDKRRDRFNGLAAQFKGVPLMAFVGPNAEDVRPEDFQEVPVFESWKAALEHFNEQLPTVLNSIEEVFNTFDADQSGAIDRDELE